VNINNLDARILDICHKASVVFLLLSQQQYISLVCAVSNKNMSLDVTALNDRDEQVAGVPRQLQIGGGGDCGTLRDESQLTNLSDSCRTRQLLWTKFLKGKIEPLSGLKHVRSV
jgi:hypothetical protein